MARLDLAYFADISQLVSSFLLCANVFSTTLFLKTRDFTFVSLTTIPSVALAPELGGIAALLQVARRFACSVFFAVSLHDFSKLRSSKG